MYHVYELSLQRRPVYLGLTADLPRSLARHLARGRRFDTLRLLHVSGDLAAARRAARHHRYLQNPLRGARY